MVQELVVQESAHRSRGTTSYVSIRHRIVPVKDDTGLTPRARRATLCPTNLSLLISAALQALVASHELSAPDSACRLHRSTFLETCPRPSLSPHVAAHDAVEHCGAVGQTVCRDAVVIFSSAALLRYGAAARSHIIFPVRHE